MTRRRMDKLHRKITIRLAYETEHGDLVAWGTHDPWEALVLYGNFVAEEYGIRRGTKEFRDAMPTVTDFERALKLWARPSAMADDGYWVTGKHVRERRGWWRGFTVPVLVVAW